VNVDGKEDQRRSIQEQPRYAGMEESYPIFACGDECIFYFLSAN
jgi:hypothetical protein